MRSDSGTYMGARGKSKTNSELQLSYRRLQSLTRMRSRKARRSAPRSRVAGLVCCVAMHRLSIQCKIMCRQFAVRHVAQCSLIHLAYLLRWRPFRSGSRPRGIPGLECRTFTEARAAPRCLISRTNERFPQAPEGNLVWYRMSESINIGRGGCWPWGKR